MQPAIMTTTERMRNTDEISLETGTDNNHPEIHARQEDFLDTEINTILKRFGLVGRPDKPRFEVTDYDLDLQTATHAIREVREAHRALPDELRRAYPTWHMLAAAIDRGEIVIKVGEAPTPEQPPKPPTT